MKTKKCTKCHKTKLLSEYRKQKRTKDGYATQCKDCTKTYDKKWYRSNPDRKKQIQANNIERIERNKKIIVEYLTNHPCVDCGETDIIVLEFDHRDRNNKVNAIGKMVQCAYSEKLIRREMAKCDVRCANCHRRKTTKEFGYFRLNAPL